MKILLDQGAQINSSDFNNNTALITAAKKNNYKAVQFLVENNADLDLVDNINYSALMYASKFGCYKSV